MRAELWTDYICPWCYLARDRSSLMVELGVEVVSRPFELHPELPPGGRPIRPGGRLATLLDHIGAGCAEVGLPFRRPERVPNSRRALEIAATVQQEYPDAFSGLDAGLFELHWVDGGDLGDAEAVDGLLDAAGLDVEEIAAAVDSGVGRRALDRSMTDARSHGITATPTWRFDQGFVLPGVQPRETVRRWVERLLARTTGDDGGRSAPPAGAASPRR